MSWLNDGTWTAITSSIAAATGLWTWISSRQTDKMIVMFGTKNWLSGAYGVTVENRSNEAINLHDWGLLIDNGDLFSLREYFYHRADPSEKSEIDGVPFGIAPRGQFSHGVKLTRLGERVVGSYAISTAHWFPRVTVSRKVPKLKRLWFKTKAIMLGK